MFTLSAVLSVPSYAGFVKLLGRGVGKELGAREQWVWGGRGGERGMGGLKPLGLRGGGRVLGTLNTGLGIGPAPISTR